MPDEPKQVIINDRGTVLGVPMKATTAAQVILNLEAEYPGRVFSAVPLTRLVEFNIPPYKALEDYK